MTWPIIFLLSVPNTNIQYTCSFAIHLIFKAVSMFVSPAICIFRWLKRQGWNQYDWLQAFHFRISTVAILTCLSSSAYPTYYITTVFYFATCFFDLVARQTCLYSPVSNSWLAESFLVSFVLCCLKASWKKMPQLWLSVLARDNCAALVPTRMMHWSTCLAKISSFVFSQQTETPLWIFNN